MVIENRYTAEVIIERDVDTMKELVEIAVKEGVDLYAANLYAANFSGVNLDEANLYGAYLHRAKGVRTFTAGEHNRFCFTYVYDSEQRYQLGCFNGNYEETRLAVEKKYGKKSHYYKVIKAYKGCFDGKTS